MFFSSDILSHPWVIPIALFFATFVLEDAAIVSGAMLATAGTIQPEMAFVALLLGIVVGDVGLYFLGKQARRFSFIQKHTEQKRVKDFRHWVSSYLFLVIFIVRFAPGLRLPCYLSCGVFTVSIKRFIWAVGVAGFFWVALAFGGVHWFGLQLSNSSFWQDAGIWKWVLVPVFGVIIYFCQRLLNGYIGRYLEIKDDQ
ncbi:DedA family protein [Sansalvadorimonas verongulae]|uniref:DedA family protein n=1 Tax=Sansalvadorimonas verongulae TaxID=2172824 RepID=UPI0012BD60A2|nr:VTT domain-containing protein [Sansalvadorimonas verongulae]MTI13724.1 hypothetical protein [Sansalvadorimonas verongulae]